MRRLLLLLAVVGVAIALPVGATASAPSTFTVQVDDHVTMCGGVVINDAAGVATFKRFNQLYPGVWQQGVGNWNITQTYTNTITHVSLQGVSVGLEHYTTDGVLDANGNLHYIRQTSGAVVTVPVPGRAPITYLTGRLVETYVIDPDTSLMVGNPTTVRTDGIYQPIDGFLQEICDYLVP